MSSSSAQQLPGSARSVSGGDKDGGGLRGSFSQRSNSANNLSVGGAAAAVGTAAPATDALDENKISSAGLGTLVNKSTTPTVTATTTTASNKASATVTPRGVVENKAATAVTPRSLPPSAPSSARATASQAAAVGVNNVTAEKKEKEEKEKEEKEKAGNTANNAKSTPRKDLASAAPMSKTPTTTANTAADGDNTNTATSTSSKLNSARSASASKKSNAATSANATPRPANSFMNPTASSLNMVAAGQQERSDRSASHSSYTPNSARGASAHQSPRKEEGANAQDGGNEAKERVARGSSPRNHSTSSAASSSLPPRSPSTIINEASQQKRSAPSAAATNGGEGGGGAEAAKDGDNETHHQNNQQKASRRGQSKSPKRKVSGSGGSGSGSDKKRDTLPPISPSTPRDQLESLFQAHVNLIVSREEENRWLFEMVQEEEAESLFKLFRLKRREIIETIALREKYLETKAFAKYKELGSSKRQEMEEREREREEHEQYEEMRRGRPMILVKEGGGGATTTRGRSGSSNGDCDGGSGGEGAVTEPRRDPNAFIEDMYRWEEDRQMKLEARAMKKRRDEEKEIRTVPKISPISEQIIQTRRKDDPSAHPSHTNPEGIDLRVAEHRRKMEELRKRFEPTFKPTITPHESLAKRAEQTQHFIENVSAAVSLQKRNSLQQQEEGSVKTSSNNKSVSPAPTAPNAATAGAVTHLSADSAASYASLLLSMPNPSPERLYALHKEHLEKQAAREMAAVPTTNCKRKPEEEIAQHLIDMQQRAEERDRRKAFLAKKREKELFEIENNGFKPLLNPKTEELAERYKSKEEQRQAEKEAQRKAREAKLLEEASRPTVVKTAPERSEEFFYHTERTLQKKALTLEKLQKEKEEKFSETHTFAPAINTLSRKIADQLAADAVVPTYFETTEAQLWRQQAVEESLEQQYYAHQRELMITSAGSPHPSRFVVRNSASPSIAEGGFDRRRAFEYAKSISSVNMPISTTLLAASSPSPSSAGNSSRKATQQQQQPSANNNNTHKTTTASSSSSPAMIGGAVEITPLNDAAGGGTTPSSRLASSRAAIITHNQNVVAAVLPISSASSSARGGGGKSATADSNNNKALPSDDRRLFGGAGDEEEGGDDNDDEGGKKRRAAAMKRRPDVGEEPVSDDDVGTPRDPRRKAATNQQHQHQRKDSDSEEGAVAQVTPTATTTTTTAADAPLPSATSNTSSTHSLVSAPTPAAVAAPSTAAPSTASSSTLSTTAKTAEDLLSRWRSMEADAAKRVVSSRGPSSPTNGGGV